MGKTGESMDEIMNRYMNKRKHDFEKLHFEYSKKIGDSLQHELMEFMIKVEDRLKFRLASIMDLFENSQL